MSGMSEKLLGKRRAQQGGKGDPDLPELRQGNAAGTVFCLEVNTMFGFGKSEHDVRITDEEFQQLKSGMSRSEQKDFDRRQRQAERDRYWELMEMVDFLEEDD